MGNQKPQNNTLPRHPAAARTTRQTARLGLAAALVFATATVCTLAFLFVTNATKPPVDSTEEIIDTAPIEIGEAGTADGGAFQILLVDKDDASKVTGILAASSIQSENRTMYRVENPDAQYFLEDGSVLRITADNGLVSMPSPQQSPEKGELSGNVRVRLFSPNADGTRADTTGEPDIDATTELPVRFDMQRGQVSTDGSFAIAGTRVSGSGIGLTVALNQVENRVSRIVIDKDGSFRVPIERAEQRTSVASTTEEAPGWDTPAALATKPPAAQEPEAPAASRDPQPEVVGPVHQVIDSIITAYRLTCLENVQIEMRTDDRGATVSAERLDAWFRLEDNALVAGAVRPIAIDLESRRTITPIISPIGPQLAPHTPIGSALPPLKLTNTPMLASVVQPEDLEPEEPKSASAELSSESTDNTQTTNLPLPNTPTRTPIPQLAPQPTEQSENELSVENLSPGTLAENAVTVSWSGRMVIVPAPIDDERLANDDAVVLLSSPTSGIVRTNDLHSDAGGTSGDVEYFATRRRLVLNEAPQDETIPPGELPMGIALDVPGFGAINATSAAVDLADASASIVGPAYMRFQNDGEPAGSARFDDTCTADIIVDGDTVYGIRSFTMVGRAELNTADGASGSASAITPSRTATGGAFRGDTITGSFARSIAGVWTIADIAAAGHAIAIDHKQGHLEADTITALFDTSIATKSNIILRTLVAEGNTKAQQPEDNVQLLAHSLEARFEPGRSSTSSDALDSPKKKLRSVLVRADLFGDAIVPATYTQQNPDTQPVHASAEHIRFDAVGRRVTLLSEDASTPAIASAGQSKIVGPQLTLDSSSRSVWVFGEGSFTSDASHDPDQNKLANVVNAQWSTEMRYDDRRGRLLAVGDVVATVHDGRAPGMRITTDELRGHRLEAQISPYQSQSDPQHTDDPIDLSQSKPSSMMGRRQLQWATVEGAVLHIENENRATATSKRYEMVTVPTSDDPQAPMLEERRLVRLGYLEADSFRVEAETNGTVDAFPSAADTTAPQQTIPPVSSSPPAQRLVVPGAGKMLMMARTPESPNSTSVQQSQIPDAPDHGQALFEWSRSMTMRQRTAEVDMNGAVRMTHIREIDGQQTYLEAERIRATLNTDSASATKSSVQSAFASEGVYIRSRTNTTSNNASAGTREARADHAEYDARKGHVVLKAAQGRAVTFYDPARGSVVEAGEVFWDLVKDIIQIRDSSPFVGAGGR